jgi:hypothetical protein
MSKDQSVERDEQTVAVENTSYKWAFIFLSFALLIDVMYRAMFRHEAAWDLMALVIAGGVGCTIPQMRQNVWTRRWVRDAVLIACAAGVVGAVVVIVWLASGFSR